MRKLIQYSMLLLVFLFSNHLLAESDVEYEEGIDYKLITPAQPTDDPSRIEVVEVLSLIHI